jgi:hypothetical protein
MSAELLRRAATQMRERAEATSSVTELSGQEWHHVESLMGEGKWAEDAEHIASWTPTVALAVADWLDLTATWFDGAPTSAEAEAALTVARAYLGESK